MRPADRPGQPGLPRPGRAPVSVRAEVSASSSTSARASRRSAMCTRSPRRRTRTPGWSTSTSTRSRSSRAAAPAGRATPYARGGRGRPARPRRHPQPKKHPEGARSARLHPAGRPTGRGAALRRRRRRSRATVVERLGKAMVPGSYLVVSHGTNEDQPDVARRRARRSTTAVSPRPCTCARTRTSCGSSTASTVVDPGLVYIPQWRPDPADDIPEDPSRYGNLVGVGRRTLTAAGGPGSPEAPALSGEPCPCQPISPHARLPMQGPPGAWPPAGPT